MAESKKKAESPADDQVTLNTATGDAKERAESRGLNADGVDNDPNADAGQKQVTEFMNRATEKGYIGAVTDPTPNENYAASNSTVDNDLPTPETDPELWKDARNRSHGVPIEAVNQTAAEVARSKAGDK